MTGPATGIAPRHPARFTNVILDTIALHVPRGSTALDPFAGTGRVHALGLDSIGVELEPGWAHSHPRTIVGNALHLPFNHNTFDLIVTSPCYGNRFADHHTARDGGERHSHTHDLGRPLHRDNAGRLQWGKQYRVFHWHAWTETMRVLRPGGMFVLNVSDHYRDHRRAPVTVWHLSVLVDGLGLTFERAIAVPTPRHRHRVDVEHVIVLRRPLDRPLPGSG